MCDRIFISVDPVEDDIEYIGNLVGLGTEIQYKCWRMKSFFWVSLFSERPTNW